ncbi:MAG: molybdopterin-containing oxidoreductase family protein [Anaerolineae bacterium]
MNETQRFSRRGFIKLGGAVGGGLLLSGRLRTLTPVPAAAQEQPEGALYGVCDVCSMGCAYIAHLQDGRIVRLTGNPKDQTAEGKLCVKGYSGLRLLYDPDRIKYPMKRTNPEKGIGVDPRWVQISWDEALDTIAANLKQVRDDYGPQAIVLIARPNTWARHFARTIGTPNHIAHNNTCYATHEVVWRATLTGKGKKWTVDYEHSRYILAFGWDGMGKSKNHWGRAVNRARMNGARLVVLDPRLSITAAKADEWIPIKPGTDLAFALAMINVIINEKLYDHQFVESYTTGLEQLREAVQEYTPEWAAPLCEVPAQTIARIAREFATTKPAVVAHHKRDAGGPNYANSWRLSHCYVILDALVGSIDRPGGHVFDRAFKLPDLPDLTDVFGLPDYPDGWKGPRIDGLEQFPILYSTGKGSFSTLANGILSQKPYPVKAAVVWKHNLLAFPDPPLLAEALKTLDFMVVSEILPSEMAQLADIVIPDYTYFEGSGLKPRDYHAMFPQVALREGLPPLYEARSFSSVTLALLRKMGLEQYAPESLSGKAIMQEQLKVLGTTVEEIRSNGGLFGDEKPLQPATEFGTPSKKIELYATVLEKEGYDPLPRWVPPRASTSQDYPYHLLIYRKPWERMTQSQNDPVFAEFWPENVALINCATGKELGISDGDDIYVESHVGKIKVRAKLTQGIRPDCVAIDHGFGHWSQGYSVAHGKGANEGDLIPALTVEEQLAVGDPGMGAMLEDFAVRVYRA